MYEAKIKIVDVFSDDVRRDLLSAKKNGKEEKAKMKKKYHILNLESCLFGSL